MVSEYVAFLPRRSQPQYTRPILVHYDADLYSSTLFVLCMLWSVTSSYYFIFDEFMGDELLALDDFSRAFPVDLEFLCSAGEYPVKVFGRMRRKQIGRAHV